MNTLQRKMPGCGALTACIALAAFLASVTPVVQAQTELPAALQGSAEMVPAGAYQGLEVIDLNEMDTMRGGFSFGGLELKFGATLSTLIDTIKLETVFNITSRGAEVVSQVLSELSAVNEAAASLANSIIANETAGTPASKVTGPAAGVTHATEAPSALQPSVEVTQPTAAPSLNTVAVTPPVIDNPIAPTTPTTPTIATATAEPAPTATVTTPTTNAPTATVTTPTTNAPTATVTTPTTNAPPAVSATAGQNPVATVPTSAAPSTSPTINTSTTNTPVSTVTQTTPPETAVIVTPDSTVSLSDLSPVDVNLDGVDGGNGFSGVVVSNNKGFTAALHKLTQDAVISAVISNASSQKISQKLDIKIDIQNIKSTREAAMRSAISKIAGRYFK